MADITGDRRSGPAGNNAPVRQHDEGDGTFSEVTAAHLRAWDATSGSWVRVTADHATGALNTTGGASGGGAATIADGADVAQGTTTDASSANTVIGILKAIKAAITGTLAVSGTVAVSNPTTNPETGLAKDSTLTGGTVRTKVTDGTNNAAVVNNADNDAGRFGVVIDSRNRLWNGAGWDRIPGDATNGQKVQSGQLPSALVSGRLSVDASGVAVPITDNAGSLTVDAPVGTPVNTAVVVSGAAVDPRSIRALTSSDVITAAQGTANATPWNDNVAQWIGSTAPTVGQKAMASSLPVVVSSDQSSIPVLQVPTGGSNVLKTGSLVTTAVTADQIVLTYTVTALKTFYLNYLVMYGRLTTPAATASVLGAISLETPSGTKVITFDDINPTTSEVEFNPVEFPQPIPIAAGVVIRVVVTPAATTSMTWRANFGGYEK